MSGVTTYDDYCDLDRQEDEIAKSISQLQGLGITVKDVTNVSVFERDVGSVILSPVGQKPGFTSFSKKGKVENAIKRKAKGNIINVCVQPTIFVDSEKKTSSHAVTGSKVPFMDITNILHLSNDIKSEKRTLNKAPSHISSQLKKEKNESEPDFKGWKLHDPPSSSVQPPIEQLVKEKVSFFQKVGAALKAKRSESFAGKSFAMDSSCFKANPGMAKPKKRMVKKMKSIFFRMMSKKEEDSEVLHGTSFSAHSNRGISPGFESLLPYDLDAEQPLYYQYFQARTKYYSVDLAKNLDNKAVKAIKSDYLTEQIIGSDLDVILGFLLSPKAAKSWSRFQKHLGLRHENVFESDILHGMVDWLLERKQKPLKPDGSPGWQYFPRTPTTSLHKKRPVHCFPTDRKYSFDEVVRAKLLQLQLFLNSRDCQWKYFKAFPGTWPRSLHEILGFSSSQELHARYSEALRTTRHELEAMTC